MQLHAQIQIKTHIVCISFTVHTHHKARWSGGFSFPILIKLKLYVWAVAQQSKGPHVQRALCRFFLSSCRQRCTVTLFHLSRCTHRLNKHLFTSSTQCSGIVVVPTGTKVPSLPYRSVQSNQMMLSDINIINLLPRADNGERWSRPVRGTRCTAN